MDRRESLKLIATGAIAVPAVIAGCGPEDKKAKADSGSEPTFNLDRNADELKAEKKLVAMDKFFTEHEMATITVLADIIIPKDEVSGSASDAKVPEFIEFIVKDQPRHQLPMRGGLQWLDMQSLKRFDKSFVEASQQQQMEIVDDIAYPEISWKDEKLQGHKIGTEKPDMKPGISFFNLMRNLTATGFYTSEIGVKDIGYIGNSPTKWNGVPDDVLKQYAIAYTDKEMQECAKY
jgi:gluconate 2-dehydrogenase subunit 3-like protein